MHESNKVNDKITEKAFRQNMIISVIGVLLCIIILCSTTWAWFTAGISSKDNTITSAYCNVSVYVEGDDGELLPTDGRYTLLAGGAYEFKIYSSGTAGSAYCIFKIDDGEYYTEQISTAEPNNFITFTLQFTSDTEVEVVTRWGTSSKDERAFYNGAFYIDFVESATPDSE